jgi:putative endonuclease
LASFYVYLVRCGDDSLYCGITDDVARRLAKHAAGKGARYTRGRGPFELVLARRCRDKGTALRLEYAIKQLDRDAKLALDPRRARGRARLATLARQIARRAAV